MKNKKIQTSPCAKLLKNKSGKIFFKILLKASKNEQGRKNSLVPDLTTREPREEGQTKPLLARGL